MIRVKEGETLDQAIKRTCKEQGHDFYRSHRCWNCNITYLEAMNEPKPSFDNDYRYTEGRHIR